MSTTKSSKIAKTPATKPTAAKSTAAKKPTADKKTAAKTSTAVKTNKSGKKIVKAAPLPETKAAATGGLDVGGLLSGVLGSLTGDSGNGSEGGSGVGGLLSGVLGALTGDSGSGEGGGLNVGAIAEMLVPLLSGDGGLLANFKKHPTKVIEKLIGIDLPDDKIDPVVEMVLSRLGHSR